MNGRVLLDTSVVIALFARDAAVAHRLAESAEAFVAAIALGELYFGARKSTRVEANLARITAFIAHSAVLACSAATAEWYGQIKNELRAKGKPIPDNDIWIAAIAREHQLTLATRDRHFTEVERLSVEIW